MIALTGLEPISKRVDLPTVKSRLNTKKQMEGGGLSNQNFHFSIRFNIVRL